MIEIIFYCRTVFYLNINYFLSVSIENIQIVFVM